MFQLLNSVDGTLSLSNKLTFYAFPTKTSEFLHPKSSPYLVNKTAKRWRFRGVRLSLRGGSEAADHVKSSNKFKANCCDEGEMEPFPHVQTLRKFPKEELVGKVVMVRFDSTNLLREEEQDQSSQSVSSAVFTIKYLHEAGAKIILVSDWRKKTNSQLHDAETVAVGIARFCSACIAGFHFEESLCQLKKVARTNKRPYVAIIGGGNLYDKAAALHFLVSRCDGVVFVGMMSFQIMHALGLSVPSYLVEPGAYKAALDIIQIAHDRNIPILHPMDFWCMNEHLPEKMGIFPSHNILDGWLPVDLGPRSLNELNSLLVKCKKILWIGPVKFKFSGQCADGASKLAQALNELRQRNCDITVVGNMACQAMVMESKCVLVNDMIENASVLWEFFKGRKLPGVMALDRAYPFGIDWKSAYCNPAQPLVVDIGSGSGLFLLGMARRRKDLNFLGLEINSKLVRRCMDSVHQYGIQNGYFIVTNATTTFRSIVSSYPGELVLVSIQDNLYHLVQCPNPDFNNPEHRWRMLQRSLIKAVVDLLALDGKIFLQSDIEAVALRMKELFLKNGKGKLNLWNDQYHARMNLGEWLEENPFGVMSDWEQHVIDRGDPMYRLMLSKSSGIE
ncbi:PREDICTED: phosphoglycerate kinase-like isoform X6 [Populus euphratica]|uniref:Phosphoglycerate kinase-like isoform X6 n=1 Tax=Populus euphratica TaxID=75702 RepID=A0AAJ6UI86_POPEU|nr:PREDICTED: phosphoglycerate kinase-like isoform X6 [Populus euphratica]